MSELYSQIQEISQTYPWVETVVGLALLTLAALVMHFLVRAALLKVINRLIAALTFLNGPDVVEAGIIRRLTRAAPAVMISGWIGDVPGLPSVLAQVIHNVANAFIILVIATTVSAIMSLTEVIWQRSRGPSGRSIKGYVQVATIVVYVIAAILMIAAVIDRSPLILLSGLGALTAVLILVFQDTLLSLVAAVQISSTDMLKVGDWIEVPGQQANGDVIEIALHTVKVQNFDKTITTVPIRKLVTEPFTNYRGMREAGARRIKRALLIDKSTIRFLSLEEEQRLSRILPIADYIPRKSKELSEWNSNLGEAGEDPANRRRMTNIGSFRAYVQAYLRQNPLIRQDQMLMARQLEPTPQGLPLEIYAFAATTVWPDYEAIQSDIFDHLIAILPEFGLSLYQAPSGRDLSTFAHDRGGSLPYI